MTSQRDNEDLVILTPFSRSQKDIKCSFRNLHIIFRPNLMDNIYLFKVLDYYVSRYKCTGGDSMSGIWLVGEHQFSLKNISSYTCL